MCIYTSWQPPAATGNSSGEWSPYKAGVILLSRDNKFLLVQNYNGKWTFPKGSIERDESVQCAAARELYEETGIVLPEQSLKVFYRYYKHIYFIYNSGDLEFYEPLIRNRTEITGIGWFCFDHIEEYDISKPTLKVLNLIWNDIESSRLEGDQKVAQLYAADID